MWPQTLKILFWPILVTTLFLKLLPSQKEILEKVILWAQEYPWVWQRHWISRHSCQLEQLQWSFIHPRSFSAGTTVEEVEQVWKTTHCLKFTTPATTYTGGNPPTSPVHPILQSDSKYSSPCVSSDFIHFASSLTRWKANIWMGKKKMEEAKENGLYLLKEKETDAGWESFDEAQKEKFSPILQAIIEHIRFWSEESTKHFGFLTKRKMKKHNAFRSWKLEAPSGGQRHDQMNINATFFMIFATIIQILCAIWEQDPPHNQTMSREALNFRLHPKLPCSGH